MGTGIQRSMFSTASPAEAVDAIAADYAGFDLTVADPSRFALRRSIIRGSRLTLIRTHLRADMSASLDPGDRIAVGQILGGRMSLQHGRDEIDLSLPYLPLGPLEARGQDTDAQMLHLDRAELLRFAQGLGQASDPHLRFTSPSPIDAAHGAYWASCIAHLVRDVIPNPAAAGSEVIRAQVFRSIAVATLNAFPNTWRDAQLAERHPSSPMPAAVRRVVDLIHAHAQEDVSIERLAQAAGLSSRGLHAAFRRELDTSPMEYLRQVRLDAAHARLRRAEPGDGTSVGAVAVEWGFSNAGRFAASYRERFGESPATTLRR